MDPGNAEIDLAMDTARRQLEASRWTLRLAKALVADPSTASDISQQTWLTALERFGRGTVPPKRWLGNTLRSLAFRSRRSAGRRSLHEARAAEHQQELQPSAAEQVEHEEARRQVAAAMADLPEAEQRALLLHFQEHLSVTQIAQSESCAKSTVSERISRGVERLREKLQAGDGRGWQACLWLAAPLSSKNLPLTAAAKASTTTLPFKSVGTASSAAKIAWALGIVGTACLVLGLSNWLSEAPIATAPATAGVDADFDPAIRSESSTAPAIAAGSAAAPSSGIESARSVVGTPKLAKAESYSITGQVLDSQARPIPKPRASLSFRDEWNRWVQGDEQGRFELTLNASDLATLPTRRSLLFQVQATPEHSAHSIYIDSKGTGRLPMPVLGKQDELGSITLLPAGSIQGRVLSVNGSPVVSARIDVHNPAELPQRTRQLREVQAPTLSDSEGRFSLKYLSEGSRTLSVEHPKFCSAPGLAVLHIREGITGNAGDLLLLPAERVTGRVVDERGAPLADVRVTASGSWSYLNTVRSAQDGSFQVALRQGSPAVFKAYVPGLVQVKPSREKALTKREFQTEHAATLVLGTGTQSSAQHSAATKTQTVRSQPSIRGQLARNGQPVENAQVLLREAWCFLNEPREVRVAGQEIAHQSNSSSASPEANHHASSDQLQGYRQHPSLRGHTIGLDGLPPTHRVFPKQSYRGQRSNSRGQFLFEDLSSEHQVFVQVIENTCTTALLGPFDLQQGSIDLALVPLPTLASLHGVIQARAAWQPTDYQVVVRGLPETGSPANALRASLKAPLEADASFDLPQLLPGDLYLGLEARASVDSPRPSLRIEPLPDFHLLLKPGQKRVLNLDLTDWLAPH